MDVDDVRTQSLYESSKCVRPGHRRRCQLVALNTVRFQLTHKRVVATQDVAAVDLNRLGIVSAGESNEQLLGAAESQRLDDP